MRAGNETAVLTRQRIAIGLFIALLGAWYFFTLRSGQPWGDDFAMYIMQARNIAEGHWSASTGYIYNPHLPKIGPPTYPPLFPLLLAPLYEIWKLNLTPMKVEVILFFLAALYLIFEFIVAQVPFPFAAGIVAVMGLSPYFWEMKESIVSDLPFLFFVMLTFCAIAACDRRGWRSTAGAIASGVCAYLGFATRTAGIVLVASLMAAAMPSWGDTRRGKARSVQALWRELRWKAVLAGVTALALIGIHSMVFRGARSYLDQLHSPWRALPHNLMAYFWNIRNVFFGVGGSAGWLFLLVLMALGFAGLAIRLRDRISPAEAFTLSYALLVLLWSSEEDLRLLIPLLPMWFLYVAVALRKLPGRSGAYAGAVLLAVVACGYTVRYRGLDTGPIREGMGDPAFVRACAYIDAQTPRGSVFVFSKPRLLALMTRRDAVAYHQPASDPDLWDYFRGVLARYVLVNRQFTEDRDYLEPLLLRNPAIRRLYGEGAFQLYALP